MKRQTFFTLFFSEISYYGNCRELSMLLKLSLDSMFCSLVLKFLPRLSNTLISSNKD